MKTTIEIADPLFRNVKATAAAKGQSLKEFVAEALEEKMVRVYAEAPVDERPWMRFAGVLREYADELKLIEADIEAAFEQIEEEEPLDP